MALSRRTALDGAGKIQPRKRLSFESPVSKPRGKRIQLDSSSDDEEPQPLSLSPMKASPLQMKGLCLAMSNCSPCRTSPNTSTSFSPCHTRSGIVYDSPLPSLPTVSRIPLRIGALSRSLRSFSPSSPSLRPRRRSLALTPALTPVTAEKSANINPFTTVSMTKSTRKRNSTGSSSGRSSRSSMSSTGSSTSLDSIGLNSDSDCDLDVFSPPVKRLRLTDMQVNRYNEEFVQIRQIADGEFGTVALARHRLDGILYAIKKTKESVKGGNAEMVAMNEVFAHAVLIKHKHVVRYYNSWVEDGRVYIQNEYCDGGSLGMEIQRRRTDGTRFTEEELCEMAVGGLRGLKYMHHKGLAHLDIKPDNIFISTGSGRPRPGTPTSDLGDTDGDEEEEGEEERHCYKIGDLGHVFAVQGEGDPQEGDCRYMAPELFEMEVDKSQLTKADIFSLGMTLYEAASLRVLPRNTEESSDYHQLQQGQLPHLPAYSKEFNCLLTSMVRPEAAERPSPRALLDWPALGRAGEAGRSREDLIRELREAREQLHRLERRRSSLAVSTQNSTEQMRSIC